jgi:hypothetical protein
MGLAPTEVWHFSCQQHGSPGKKSERVYSPRGKFGGRQKKSRTA